jgi:hypothetical protein
VTTLDALLGTIDAPRVHLAIMREPWMRHILNGRKTVESRFCRVACLPWDAVREGDAILFKRSGHPPILAMARVAWVEQHTDPRSPLVRRHADALCVDDSFFAAHDDCRYITVIGLTDAQPTSVHFGDTTFVQNGRAGWLLLRDDVQTGLAL